MSTSTPRPTSSPPDVEMALARLGVGLESPTLGRRITNLDVASAGGFDPSQLSPSKTVPGLAGSRRAGLSRVRLAVQLLNDPRAVSDESPEDIRAARAIVQARSGWLPEMLDYSVSGLAEKLVEWGMALPGTAAGILAGRLDMTLSNLEGIYNEGGWTAIQAAVKEASASDGASADQAALLG
jgi:hypothetical protein